MPKIDRIYRRTALGTDVLKRATVGAAEGEYRRILRLINGEMHFDMVRAALREYEDGDVCQFLEELERRGFISSAKATAAHDLDFTGRFSVSDFAGKQAKKK